ncbi:MAG: glycosyltransferase family 2 protein [Methyloglobulus sp.]|nr:glycosyltransferase family 2 protein [Methyloglobulus sp.]
MILEFLLTLFAVLISTSLLMVSIECLVTIIKSQSQSIASGLVDTTHNYRILIPAHNEGSIIGNTLSQMIAQLPNQNPADIVVVADNCTDNTADIARSLDVVVLERTNIEQRGKGFALDFGIQYLRANNPPKVLVIMDADCETDKASFVQLINSVIKLNLPAQMTYLMRIKQDASIKQKIAGFAWLLKNKVRLIAVNILGLPVTLTGTGMAFPWQVFDHVQIGHGNIVEDMQLGIDCAVNRFPPVLCPEAIVYSDFPEQASAELSQRTRWEHGHLQTIFKQVPALIKQSYQQKNWRLLALALDIGVPPLSLLVATALSSLALLGVFSLVTGNATAFFILLASFSFFTAMLSLVWWIHGQAYLSAKEVLSIPLYVVSKLSIYTSFILKRQKEWVRTNRDA